METTANLSSNLNIIEGSDQTFVADVIESSKSQLVLVDFWATWCGPCKSLTPNLEEATRAKAGRVKLVKIDIDKNPSIAGQLGVRSVPTVFAFNNGQPVDAFQGALPKAQIDQFIDKQLAGTEGGQATADVLQQADEHYRSGDISTAAQLYAQVVNQENDNVEAISGLARCYHANGDIDRAKMTLDMVPEDKRDNQAVKSVLTAIELAGEPPVKDEFEKLVEKLEENPSDHETRYKIAEALISINRYQDGADQLFAILQSELDWGEGKAKQKLLKLFEAVGPTDPITTAGRRRLSSLVFS